MDTPSSFASGPSTSEYRQKLIKACVDAFKSSFLGLSTIIIIEADGLLLNSQCYPRRWPREVEC